MAQDLDFEYHDLIKKKTLVVHPRSIYIAVALGCRIEMTLFLCPSAQI